MTWFGDLVDAILPPTVACRSARMVSNDDLRPYYRPREIQETHILTYYNDPVVRSLIHACKFSNDRAAAQKLSIFLKTWLQNQSSTYDIIPIPLSTQRFRARGYNQVTRIIVNTLQSTPHRLQTNVLLRTRDTTPQTSLAKSERLSNVAQAFSISTEIADFSCAHILLIDDVTTTGATLKAARSQLTHLTPATITCLAIAG